MPNDTEETQPWEPRVYVPNLIAERIRKNAEARGFDFRQVFLDALEIGVLEVEKKVVEQNILSASL